MTGMERYDAYDGPKGLSREGCQWTCRLAINLPLATGGVTGFELCRYGDTPDAAADIAFRALDARDFDFDNAPERCPE